MPGIGALVRAVRGIAEGNKLDAQCKRLEALALTDASSLVVEGYHSCAALRHAIASYRLADEVVRPRLADEVVRQFETIREETMQDLLAQAHTEPAGRDEVLRLVQTLDQYARAAQEDIGRVEDEALRRSKAHEAALAEAVREVRDDVGRVEDEARRRSKAHEAALAEAVREVRRIGAAQESASARLTSLDERMESIEAAATAIQRCLRRTQALASALAACVLFLVVATLWLLLR